MLNGEEFKIKDEIIILEDMPEQGETLIKHLKFNEDYIRIRYFKSLNELEKIIGKSGVYRYYLVDIHLGEGKADDGIKAIKMIREHEPDSFIIVYSGYPDKEHECIEAGADIFFLKDPVTYKDDVKQIKNTMSKLLHKKEENEKKLWRTVTKVYSKIVDIDKKRNQVHLICKLKNGTSEIFKRIFPLAYFKNNDKLVVGQSIQIQILEQPGEVRFLFKESEEDYFEDEAEDIHISDLEDSPLFKIL